MKYQIAIVLLFSIACSLALAGCTTGNTTAKDEIIIGVIGPFSGDAAIWGQWISDGVNFAADTHGDTQYTYRLVFEDDNHQKTQAISALRKVTTIDQADAIIGISSQTGNAIAGIVEEQRQPTCIIGSDPQMVAGKTYVFKHWTPPASEAARYIEEAERLGYKKLAIFRSMDQGTEAMLTPLLPLLDEKGIAYEQKFVDTDRQDFKTELLSLDEFDAFVIITNPAQTPVLLRQIHEHGFEQDITAIETPELVDDPAIFEGAWYINAAEGTNAFREEYETARGEAPLAATAYGYDCYNLLVKGFEEGGKEDAMGVISTLKDYESAVGTVYYDQGTIMSQAIKKRIINGEPVVEEE